RFGNLPPAHLRCAGIHLHKLAVFAPRVVKPTLVEEQFSAVSERLEFGCWEARPELRFQLSQVLSGGGRFRRRGKVVVHILKSSSSVREFLSLQISSG